MVLLCTSIKCSFAKEKSLKYSKISTIGPVPKHWIVCYYIPWEDYELDLNFDETEMKKQSDHTSNDKVKLFYKNIVVIEE